MTYDPNYDDLVIGAEIGKGLLKLDRALQEKIGAALEKGIARVGCYDAPEDKVVFYFELPNEEAIPVATIPRLSLTPGRARRRAN